MDPFVFNMIENSNPSEILATFVFSRQGVGIQRLVNVPVPNCPTEFLPNPKADPLTVIMKEW
jgi:hypothetical protein